MQTVYKNESDKPILVCTAASIFYLHSSIYDIVDSAINKILNSINSAIHSIHHWLMYYYMKRKEPTTCNNMHAIIAAIKTHPCIAPQHKVFLSISEKLRHIHLLKPRSRGSNDDFISVAS